MYRTITELIQKLEQEESKISASRKVSLDKIAAHFTKKQSAGDNLQPLVVCTHNSRRSHIGQIWFSAAADYFGIQNLSSYSAGTMATELNPRVVKALETVGFSVEVEKQSSSNPNYQLSWSAEGKTLTLFSKEYTNQSIPKEEITAIMVCTDADENCPFIPGADARFSLPFEDPKAADDSPNEANRYLESLHEIGREIVYLLKRV